MPKSHSSKLCLFHTDPKPRCEECGTSHARLIVLFRTLVCEACARRHLREMQQDLQRQAEVQR